MNEELFVVWQCSADDWRVKAAEGLPAKLAVGYARWMTQTQEARCGEIQRIIITDEANHTVFEWKFGEGVTFRTPKMRATHRLAASVLSRLSTVCRYVRSLFHSL